MRKAAVLAVVILMIGGMTTPVAGSPDRSQPDDGSVATQSHSGEHVTVSGTIIEADGEHAVVFR
jgi:hypothetical protein